MDNMLFPQAQQSFADTSLEINGILGDIQIQIGEIVIELERIRKNLEDAQNYAQLHFSADWESVCNHLEIQADLESVWYQLFKVISTLSELHEKILCELESFKDEQRLVILRKTCDKDLNSIEQWFQSLGQCFSKLEHSALPTLGTLCTAQKFQPQKTAEDMIETYQDFMKKASYVIETHPNQVVRDNFGDVKLRLFSCCPNTQIKSKDAVFINEETAKKVCQKEYDHSILPQSAYNLKFELSGQKGTIEYTKMKLTKKKKSVGRHQITQDRFWLYFRIKIDCLGCTNTFWTLSLPFWVITHPSQEAKVWTHMIWHNAFPTKSRYCLWDTPSEIDWSLLILTIDQLFQEFGRQLSEHQKNYLKKKMIEKTGFPDENTGMLHKRNFCSDKFSLHITYDTVTAEQHSKSPPVSFGEWIFYCWNILRWQPPTTYSRAKELKYYWAEGKILGFMDSHEIETMLRSTQSGTFIIRFPEKRADCIGLYYYKYHNSSEETNNTAEKLCKFVYTIRTFNVKPFENIVMESEAATYLYSDFRGDRNGRTVPKAVAFEKIQYGSTSTDGYFKTRFKEYIPKNWLKLLKMVPEDA